MKRIFLGLTGTALLAACGQNAGLAESVKDLMANKVQPTAWPFGVSFRGRARSRALADKGAPITRWGNASRASAPARSLGDDEQRSPRPGLVPETVAQARMVGCATQRIALFLEAA